MNTLSRNHLDAEQKFLDLEGMVRLIRDAYPSENMWFGRVIALGTAIWPAMEYVAARANIPVDEAMLREMLTIEGMRSFVATYPGTDEARAIENFLVKLPGYRPDGDPGAIPRENLGFITMQISRALEFRAQNELPRPGGPRSLWERAKNFFLANTYSPSSGK